MEREVKENEGKTKGRHGNMEMKENDRRVKEDMKGNDEGKQVEMKGDMQEDKQVYERK